MNEQLPKTITDLLKGVNDNPDDENKAYLLAATFNLYSEAMRRMHGRVLLNAGDVRAILDMAYTMIVQPPKAKIETPKIEERELTIVEQDQVLKAITPERRV